MFSILTPLIAPAWATYQSLEANTLIEENSLGSEFSTVQRVSPLRIKEKMHFEPCLVWLISTEVHSLMGGFLVLKNFPTLDFPPKVVVRYTPLVLWHA